MLTLRARGQTLPIWAMGLAAALVLAFSALQYGQVLRWQIRAQNAADAAAAGALSVQTSAWNQQIAMIYASSVEEWRIRNLLEGMVMAAADDPGCQPSCAALYAEMRGQYARAVARYTNDVQIMNQISQYTYPQAVADAKAIVASFQQNCGAANGGDCAFSYTVTDMRKRSPLTDVEQDAGAWVVNGVAPAAVKDDYNPAQMEVVACANVPPLVAPFLNFTPPTFKAVGRAAATSAMATEEWIQPGVIVNPQTGKPFQPVEPFTNDLVTSATGPGGHNWFVNDYGGNPATAYPLSDAYSENISGPEFSAVTGWWSTIPIKPYSGALAPGSITCSGS